MILKELTNSEFARFTDYYNIHSVYQTKEYAFVMNNQNFESVFLGLVDEKGQILAASLILIDKIHNFKYAYAPRGFLIDYHNFELLELFTKEIKKYLGKRNVIAIKLNPYLLRYTHEPWNRLIRKDTNYDLCLDHLKQLGYRHLGYNHFFESLKPRYEAVISLDLPYYQLFRNIRKEFRTKIRSAEKRGLQMHLGNENDLQYLYLHTQKKYPRDLKYFKDCYHFFSSNHMVDFYYIKLDVATYLSAITKEYHNQDKICATLTQKLVDVSHTSKEKYLNQKIAADQLFNQYKKELIYATNLLKEQPNGIVIASALVVTNQKEAYLLMDGYDTKYKRLNAKHLLIWKLCEKYSKEGYHTFNLGGVTNLDLPKNPYHGLNDFKIGFHATIKEYMGDLELVTNNTLYFMYKNSASFRNIQKK